MLIALAGDLVSTLANRADELGESLRDAPEDEHRGGDPELVEQVEGAASPSSIRLRIGTTGRAGSAIRTRPRGSSPRANREHVRRPPLAGELAGGGARSALSWESGGRSCT